MEEKILTPIKESSSDFEAIEKRIIQLFKTEIYLPLIKLLGFSSKTLQNAKDDLIKALVTGQVTYDNGSFNGRLNASISKELKALGATWDRKQRMWKIPQSSLPGDILSAIATSEIRFMQTLEKINKKLTQILPEEIADKLDVAKLFDSTLYKVEKKFKDSIKGLATPPDLSAEAKKKIAQEYTNNMRLYIKDFTEKEIVKLRKDVQSKVFTGQRYESLAKKIQSSYGVSQTKAKFLARQETSLLMSKFKEARYKDAGVHEYIWGCVHMPKDKSPGQHNPGNVRFSHGILEGKRFRFDSPPIVNDKGERKNPGEDFNCRCFAKPIVRF